MAIEKTVETVLRSLTPRFILDSDGKITGLELPQIVTLKDTATGEVYVEGRTVVVDVWGKLTAAQKTTAQNMLDRLKTLASS